MAMVVDETQGQLAFASHPLAEPGDGPGVTYALQCAERQLGRSLSQDEAQECRQRTLQRLAEHVPDPAKARWKEGTRLAAGNGSRQPPQPVDGLIPAHSDCRYGDGQWRQHPCWLAKGLLSYDLGGIALIVYLACWEKAGRIADGFEAGELRESLAAVARDLGLKYKQVHSAVSRLRDKGLIGRSEAGKVLVMMPAKEVDRDS